MQSCPSGVVWQCRCQPIKPWLAGGWPVSSVVIAAAVVAGNTLLKVVHCLLSSYAVRAKRAQLLLAQPVDEHQNHMFVLADA